MIYQCGTVPIDWSMGPMNCVLTNKALLANYQMKRCVTTSTAAIVKFLVIFGICGTRKQLPLEQSFLLYLK